jgi:hypothetical protein
LDVDIGDVGIELDPIPYLSSIGNEVQYKYVVWVYLELQFHTIPRILDLNCERHFLVKVQLIPALNSLASQTAEFRIPISNSSLEHLHPKGV